MVSAVLLSLSPTFDHQVAIRMMSVMKDEIGTALLRAHQQLNQDEERLRAEEAESGNLL
jgi:hypothetical protein